MLRGKSGFGIDITGRDIKIPAINRIGNKSNTSIDHRNIDPAVVITAWRCKNVFFRSDINTRSTYRFGKSTDSLYGGFIL